MHAREIIEQCRALFNGTAHVTSRGGLFGLFKKSGPLSRDFALDCGGDDDVGLTEHYRTLYAHGRIVWGAIAQANSKLFARGGRDLPANTVFSTDPHFDDSPDELRDVGHDIFAVKETTPKDPDVARMAALITDELNYALNVPVPHKMAGGREVLFTTTWIQRRRLPTGYLTDGVFPLLICPERTPQNMVLPLRFWSQGLVDEWRRADAAIPESAKAAPAPNPISLDNRLPWADYAPKPVHLTPAAATEVRQIMRAQGMAEHAYLWVGIRPDDGYEYVLDIREDATAPDAFMTASHGVTVVVEPAMAVYLVGTEIDFRSSADGRKGFVFNNPNVRPKS